MTIRKATPSDLEEIIKIYHTAKAFMISTGNKSQWLNGYPQRELLEEDIAKGYCHVYEDHGIHGVFALIEGEDPTYREIEDGQWLNNKPYGTIHRIGSDGTVKGVLAAAVDYCKTICPVLRIDTHYDNKVMQHLVTKNGFRRCGIIHLADGSPRIAYQYTSEI